MKNFGKYLFLLLTFLSIGGGSTYGNNFAEIRKDHPFSSEDLRAAAPALWAFRENPFQDIPDLSENNYFGSISVLPENFSNTGKAARTNLDSGFNRDLRRILFQQIFPKHFFL